MKRASKLNDVEVCQSEMKESCVCGGGDDHYFTVVFRKMMYYRWVVSGRMMKNGMKSRNLLQANTCKL